MMDNTYGFVVLYNENDTPDFGHATRFRSSWTVEDDEWLAQDAAAHYHSQCDGWESEWPLTFVIYDDETEIGRYLINREYEPTFIVDRKVRK